MKNCPKCNRELRDEAKFCGGCGYNFAAAAAPMAAKPVSCCPACGKTVAPNARFCSSCGSSLANATAAANNTVVMDTDKYKYINWSILPGQLAIKLTEKDIDSYGAIHGITIQDGLKALLFFDGKIVSELNSGSYNFEAVCEKEFPKPGAWRRFFSKLFRFQLPEYAHSIGFVLIRANEFPVIYEFPNMQTAAVSCNVGLHLLCKISNINEFYRNLLLDRKYVSFREISDAMKVAIQSNLAFSLRDIKPEDVASSPGITTYLTNKLAESIAEIYPYIQISRILNISTDNDGLNRLRQMSDELYIAGKTLDASMKRMEFLNRLQAVNNEQELTEDRNELEFTRRKNKIYEEMALTQDERDKFDLALKAQRMIREAKTQDELQNAINEFRKSEILREDEIKQLQQQLAGNSKLKEVNANHLIAMAAAKNRIELDREKLEWERAVGTQLVTEQLKRRQMTDDYEHQQKQRQLDLDKQEQLNQLDILKQAQDIRMARENNLHRNEMEKLKAEKDAALEEKRIYAGMSFEQIMAINPDISADAAQALARKFDADSAKQAAQDAVKQRDMMVNFMQQQMAAMKEMAMAGITAGAANQQAMLQAKQDELDRTRIDASANNDRILDGMKTTVSAVAGMKNHTRGKICPQCQAAVENDAVFCSECGSSL